MHRFWRSLIEPILARLEPRVIVEIGSEAGLNTRNLLVFCKTHGAVLHAVDPEPAFDAADFESAFPGLLFLHRARSLDALAAIGPADAVLVDGDHNWYTVFNELLLLQQIAAEAKRPFPLALLHDTGWPYARRDVYYRPEEIPPPFRNDFADRGMVPWSQALVEQGGMNDGLANATHEQGVRNGVLTAIEDFLAATAAPIDFLTVPGFHGLGVLCSIDLVEANKPFRQFLQELRAASVVETHLHTLEEARLRQEIDLWELRRQTGGLEAQLEGIASERQRLEAVLETRVEDATRERQRVEGDMLALEARLADGTRERQQLEAQVAATQGERSKLQQRLSELEQGGQALELRLKALQRELAARTSELAERQAEAADLRSHSRALGEQLGEQSARNAELTEQVQSLTETHTAETNRLEGEVLKREREVLALEGEVLRLGSQVDTLSRDHADELDRVAAEFEELFEADKRTIGELEAEVGRLEHARAAEVDRLGAELRLVTGARDAENTKLRQDLQMLGRELVRHGRLRFISQLLSWILRRPSRKRLRWVREYRALRRSGAFDSAFYLGRYPDVARARMNPVMHYLEHGAREGRDPSPSFDTSAYVAAHPDAVTGGVNPLFHSLSAQAEPAGHATTSPPAPHAPPAEAALAAVSAPSGALDRASSPTANGLPHSYHETKRLADYRPRISAIVPNYNHARFLEQRLQSIVNQTYRPHEIILLDDASTDSSRAVIEELVRDIEIPVTTVFNEANSANVFKQWQAGISFASGDLIWICESDDFCENDFLAHLVPHLADPSVTLAFGKIEFADAVGASDTSLDEYFEEAAPGQWCASRIASAFEWFRGPFGLLNVIPNVGGCVFRRQTLSPEIWKEAQEYSVCGDWYLYMQLARGGRIAYDVAAVSYFRQHEANTSVSTFKKPAFYEEYFRIARELRKTYGTSDSQARAFYARAAGLYLLQVGEDTARFRSLFDLDELLETGRSKHHLAMGILGFKTGGGELFPINLANELVSRGYNVSLLVLDAEEENPRVRALLRPEIPVYERRLIDEIGPRTFLETHGVDLLHTHFLGVDLWLHEAAQDVRIPHVVTMHGSYEVDEMDDARKLSLLRAVDLWVYTADKNLGSFAGCDLNGSHFTKLPNAVPVTSGKFPFDRRELGVPEDGVVFGLASRALRAKGWDTAIAGLRRVRGATARPVHLVFCGDGPDFVELTERYEHTPGVTFLGYQSEIIGFYRICDCCLLPTRFAGESFPFTLIESLQAATPIIATDLGDIRNIVQPDGTSAGILVPNLSDDAEFADAVAGAMLQMLDDDLRATYADAAGRLAREYSFERLVSDYEAIYERAGWSVHR